MRDPNRIKIIMDYLREVWEDNPDWRLTQLLVNTGVVPNFPGTWYYYEDSEFVRNIEALKEDA
jgi:uncharacterized protein YihD (DUF1040 family)